MSLISLAIGLALIVSPISLQASHCIHLFSVDSARNPVFGEVERRLHDLLGADAQSIIRQNEAFLEEVQYDRDHPFSGNGLGAELYNTLWAVHGGVFDRPYLEANRAERNRETRLTGSLRKFLDQGESHPHLETWKEVARFLEDKVRFSLRMLELQLDVGMQRKKMVELHDYAFEGVLANWEQRHGMTLVRANRRLTYDQINNFFLKGIVFKDYYTGPGNPHGHNTHRLQLNLVMREFEGSPEKFKDSEGNPVTFMEFYRGMGTISLSGQIYSRTEHPIWTALFDSFFNSPTSPAFFNLNRAYWPGLGWWE